MIDVWSYLVSVCTERTCMNLAACSLSSASGMPHLLTLEVTVTGYIRGFTPLTSLPWKKWNKVEEKSNVVILYWTVLTCFWKWELIHSVNSKQMYFSGWEWLNKWNVHNKINEWNINWTKIWLKNRSYPYRPKFFLFIHIPCGTTKTSNTLQFTFTVHIRKVLLVRHTY